MEISSNLVAFSENTNFTKLKNSQPEVLNSFADFLMTVLLISSALLVLIFFETVKFSWRNAVLDTTCILIWILYIIFAFLKGGLIKFDSDYENNLQSQILIHGYD